MAYNYSRTLTIDHTKVGSSDLTDFPVLVYISDPTFRSVSQPSPGHITSSSGFDIVFYADAAQTTPLYWETDYYDPTTGNFYVHVMLPTVSHTSDTTFYCFYSNSAITTFQSTASSVWDSNFKSVFHLNQNPTGSAPQLVDSTSNANHLTVTTSLGSGPAATPFTTSGQIGQAVRLPAEDQYDGAQAQASTNSGLTTWNFTISCWVNENNPVTHDNGYGQLFGQLSLGGQVGIMCRNPDGGGYECDTYDFLSTGMVATSSSPAIAANVWHLVHLVGDGTNQHLYVDGTHISQTAITSSHSSLNGLATLNGRIPFFVVFVDATFDEFRLSNTTRSSSWITAEYHNQFSPETFITIGAEESASTFSLTVSASTATCVGSVSRGISKHTTGTNNQFSGHVQRSAGLLLSALTTACAGSLVTARAFFMTLAASMNGFAGTIKRGISRKFEALCNQFIGAKQKALSRTIHSQTHPNVGSFRKTTEKRLAGIANQFNASVAVGRRYSRILTAALSTCVVALKKTTARHFHAETQHYIYDPFDYDLSCFDGSAGLPGTVVKLTTLKLPAVTHFKAGSLSRIPGKLYQAGLHTMSGVLRRASALTFYAVTQAPGFPGTLKKKTGLGLSVMMSTCNAVVTKASSIQIAASLHYMMPALTKSIGRTLRSVTHTMNGSSRKTTSRIISGITDGCNGAIQHVSTYRRLLTASASAMAATIVKVVVLKVSAVGSGFNGVLNRAIFKTLKKAVMNGMNGSIIRLVIFGRAFVATMNGFHAKLFRSNFMTLVSQTAGYIGSTMKHVSVLLSAITNMMSASVRLSQVYLRTLIAVMGGFRGGTFKGLLKILRARSSGFSGATSHVSQFVRTLVASTRSFSGRLNKATAKTIKATFQHAVFDPISWDESFCDYSASGLFPSVTKSTSRHFSGVTQPMSGVLTRAIGKNYKSVMSSMSGTFNRLVEYHRAFSATLPTMKAGVRKLTSLNVKAIMNGFVTSLITKLIIWADFIFHVWQRMTVHVEPTPWKVPVLASTWIIEVPQLNTDMAGFTKVLQASDAVQKYLVTWQEWLSNAEDDVIIASSWTADSGIMLASDDFTTTETYVWVSGGTTGSQYSVTNHILTDAGREFDKTFIVVIGPT